MTTNDELVLNAIFNPHNPLQIEEKNVETKHDEKPLDLLSDELKSLEIDAVNCAQKGNLDESLNLFNKLIENVPNYASGYNNRAQLYRLKGL